MYADNKETDVEADASTTLKINIEPIATVGQTGPGNANMELHLMTSKHLQLDHNHGVAYNHEQKSPARSRTSMELHLIMSKHLQLGHVQAWSFT